MTAPICVAGATGATGSRTARVLVDAGVPVVLAGRNGELLAELSDELGGAEYRVFDIGSPDSLDAAFDGVSVVAGCAGPFTRIGMPIAEAAVRVGAHHVDTTGESVFSLSLLRSLDGPARERGVTLVTSIGGSSTIADLAAADCLQQCGSDRVHELTLGYRIIGMHPTAGTLRSEIDILADGAVVVQGGELVVVPPGGPPRLLPAGPGTRFPVADPVVISRYSAVPSIGSFIVAPAPGLVGSVLRGGYRVCKQPWIRARLRDLADKLPPLDDGKPHGTMTVDATAWGRFGVRTTTVSGGDVYGFTARATALVSRALAAGAGAGGLRAASEVVGDLEATMRELGLEVTRHAAAVDEPVSAATRS